MAQLDTPATDRWYEEGVDDDHVMDQELINFLHQYNLDVLGNKLRSEGIQLQHLKAIDMTDLDELCASLQLKISHKIRFKTAIKELQRGSNVEYDHEQIDNKEQESNDIEEFFEFYPMEQTVNVKAVVIGDSGVGKTCIVNRLYQNEFDDCVANTIGFELKRVRFGKGEFNIFDTAGHQTHRDMASLFYRGTYAIIIVYNITDRSTYIEANRRYKEAFHNAIGYNKMLLIGNKLDLAQQGQRKVAMQEALNFAAERGMTFLEVSAKTAQNFNSFKKWLMAQAVNKAVDESKEDNIQDSKINLEARLLAPDPKPQKKLCC